MRINEFILELKKNRVEISEEKLLLLEKYYEYLLEYNKHTNLTSIIDKESVYLKHFYDSLTLSFYIDFKNIKTVLDVGSGAGFPGIVLKIIFPTIRLTIVESNSKKVKFLNKLVQLLRLNDVIIINDRVENLEKKYYNYFDLVTARAVTRMISLTELCLPFVKINGFFAPLKGKIFEEIEESKYCIEVLGGNIISQNSFNLPLELSDRTIPIIIKKSSSPKGYPRSYDKILKKPLKK